jgi:cellulose synthase/poly-beta-1,6-N-acetylglucosamine synthase-like glycosyltransferase
MNDWTLPLQVTVMGLGCLGLVPATTFLMETLLGASTPTGRPAALTASAKRPRVTVLIPAHNEASGIARTLRSVLPQLGPDDTLLVVADNCQDDTAVVARQHGAQVLERSDTQRRGKGYALDHGISALRPAPPDIVVMLDADCVLTPGALEALVQTSQQQARPVQARYLMQAPELASLKTRVASFAWLVKNQVRPAGAQRLGWPCQLTGSGMAFPWHVIESAPLASGHLVEDMQLGLDLAIAGQAPFYCHDALVMSEFPTDAHGLQTQRSRWEHGHLGVIRTQAPRLLKASLVQGRADLLGMSLDLSVPPLSSLVAVMALLSMAGTLLSVWSGQWWATWPSLIALAFVMLGTTWAWREQGQHVLRFQDLLGIPFYVLGKVPIYIRYFTKREATWIRTRRQDGQD